MNNMNIDTMTITELKALAYDLLASIEASQRNLQVVNQEIAKKSQPAVEPMKEDKKKP